MFFVSVKGLDGLFLKDKGPLTLNLPVSPKKGFATFGIPLISLGQYGLRATAACSLPCPDLWSGGEGNRWVVATCAQVNGLYSCKCDIYLPATVEAIAVACESLKHTVLCGCWKALLPGNSLSSLYVHEYVLSSATARV